MNDIPAIDFSAIGSQPHEDLLGIEEKLSRSDLINKIMTPGEIRKGKVHEPVPDACQEKDPLLGKEPMVGHQTLQLNAVPENTPMARPSRTHAPAVGLPRAPRIPCTAPIRHMVSFTKPTDKSFLHERLLGAKSLLQGKAALTSNSGGFSPEQSLPYTTGPSGLKAELTQLVQRADFSLLSASFVLTQLIGLVELHKANIRPEFHSFEELEQQGVGSGQKVPDHIRQELAQVCGIPVARLTKGSHAPVGHLIYIGSPLDGEMIISNADVVDSWHAYIRLAYQQSHVAAENEMISLNTLPRLVNVAVMPPGRHFLEINYGYEEICSSPTHSCFMWKSSRYPCTIKSCRKT